MSRKPLFTFGALVTLLALTILLPPGAVRVVAAGQTFVVNTVQDQGFLPRTAMSLRRAIVAANNNPGPDRIIFKLPNNATRIDVGAPLPPVLDGVEIDGVDGGKCGIAPCVHLDGAWAGPNVNGLDLLGHDSTVRGLIVTNFSGAGIHITGDRNRVEANTIGASQLGDIPMPNHIGIVIDGNASYNVIQGDRRPNLRAQIVTGNEQGGILIGGAATYNAVVGNIIGTNWWRDKAVGNGSLAKATFGIKICCGAHSNFIGSLPQAEIGDPASGNIITWHHFGIWIEGPSRLNRVRNNIIGTNERGDPCVQQLCLANVSAGILLNDGAKQNVIGGNDEHQPSYFGNTIAFNRVGVMALDDATDGNSIRYNSIFDNVGLGIQLGRSITPLLDDAGDADVGPNDLQNYPILTSVVIDQFGTTVTGALYNQPNLPYLVDFYWSRKCDPSKYGEGEVWFGRQSVGTDGNGEADFTVSTGVIIPNDAFVTSTATFNAGDSAGSTSEFSRCLKRHTPRADTGMLMSGLPKRLWDRARYSITATNNGPDTARQVVVRDTLPRSLQLVSCAATGGGVCDGALNDLTISFRRLKAGASETITLEVQLAPVLSAPGELVSVVPVESAAILNSATIESATLDPDLSNNIATACVTFTPPSAPVGNRGRLPRVFK